MLVLSRRLNQKIVFPEIQATVQVVSVKPGVVRLGVDAPPDITVFREEIAPQAAAEKDGLPSIHRLTNAVRGWLNSCTTGLARLREQLSAGLHQQADATIANLKQEIDTLQHQLADTRFPKPINPEPQARPHKQETGAAA